MGKRHGSPVGSRHESPTGVQAWNDSRVEGVLEGESGPPAWPVRPSELREHLALRPCGQRECYSEPATRAFKIPGQRESLRGEEPPACLHGHRKEGSSLAWFMESIETMKKECCLAGSNCLA